MSGIEIALAVLIVLATGLIVALLYRRRSASGTAPRIDRQPVHRPLRHEQEPPSGDGATAESSDFVLDAGSGRRLFAQLIEPGESARRHRPDTMITRQSSAVALDKVIETVPVIGMAVMGGKWVRILNPEALALGDQIKSKSGGFLAGIFGPDKKFAAQLRFSKPEDLAATATPLAVFKVASMVTGQYYLNRIDTHLTTIEGQVRAVRQDLRNETYAEITAPPRPAAGLGPQLASSRFRNRGKHASSSAAGDDSSWAERGSGSARRKRLAEAPIRRSQLAHRDACGDKPAGASVRSDRRVRPGRGDYGRTSTA